MIAKKRHEFLKKVIFTTALLMAVGLVWCTKVSAETLGTVTAEELNVRSGAGIDFDKISVNGENCILKAQDKVVVLGEKDGWYRIRFAVGATVGEGYSNASYIVPADSANIPSENRTGTVIASELNVRTGPGTTYDKAQVSGQNVVLVENTALTVLGESDGWFHIRTVYSGSVVDGWCLGDYIEAGPATETGLRSYTAGNVTATELNMRQGPSTDYDRVSRNGEGVVLKNGDTVNIIEENDGWYHLFFVSDGEILEGYCKASYIATEGVVSTSGDVTNDGTGSKGTGKTDSSDSGEDKTGQEDDGAKTQETGTEQGSTEETPFSPTDLSNGVPDGYSLKSKTYSASLLMPGKVMAETGLNLRKSAKSTGTVLAVLPNESQVQILKSIIKKTKDSDGNYLRTRWYRVVADVDGKYVAGYVLSQYVEAEWPEGVKATVRNDNQTLGKYAKDGSTKVKTSKKKTVKLEAGTSVEILSEKTGSDGVKYIRVKVKYGKKTYKGYIPASDLTYITTPAKYKVSWLVKSEKNASVKEEEKDEPAPAQEFTFEGANAFIKNAAALTVHVSPGLTSEILFTGDEKLVTLKSGDSVELLEMLTENGTEWCSVRFLFGNSEYTGYVRAEYVESDSNLALMSDDGVPAGADETTDFEAMLDAEGFPESYRTALRELHEKYPLWVFKAFHTELDWETVIAEESVLGRNLLPDSYSIEWKSLKEGAYSWKTDSFVPFDSTYWVTASETALRYYMDPRNFLDEKGIFEFEELTYSPDYHTEEGVANILKNTFMNGETYTFTDDSGQSVTMTYPQTFMMAAEYTGVSPYHLASRVKQEVTIGASSRSNSVTGEVSGYEGLYNFYNIGANDSTKPGENIRNGLKFALNGSKSAALNLKCLISWTNPFRAILGGAEYIGTNYILKGQNTLYLEKFNVTQNGTYVHQYMTNVEASYHEGLKVYNGYTELEEKQIVFSIPVYTGMPEQASPKPEKAYNPNNRLKTLEITDEAGNSLALTPTFDYTADCEYDLIVEESIETIKIKAKTVSKLASITSKDTFTLKKGVNKVVIKVKAENGDIRKYILHVVREGVPDEETGDIDTDSESGAEGSNAGADGSGDGTGTGSGEPGSDGTGAEGNNSGADASGEGNGTGSGEPGSDGSGAEGNNSGADGSGEGTGAGSGEPGSDGSGAEGNNPGADASGEGTGTGSGEPGNDGTGAEGNNPGADASDGGAGTDGSGEGSGTI